MMLSSITETWPLQLACSPLFLLIYFPFYSSHFLLRLYVQKTLNKWLNIINKENITHPVCLANTSIIGNVFSQGIKSIELFKKKKDSLSRTVKEKHQQSTYDCMYLKLFWKLLATYMLSSCEVPREVSILVHHALGLFFKIICRLLGPPVNKVSILVKVSSCNIFK
jgi:hypothetical protein